MATDRTDTLSFDLGLSSLVDLGDRRLAELIPLMKPIAAFEGFNDHERQLIGWLSTASVRASGSALVLVNFGKVWDAEIVSRSAFEGTMKFCHLLSDREKFSSRLSEYERALPDIAALADHEKAARLIDALPGIDEELLAPIRELFLTRERQAAITALYPRDVRRKLQSAWGFTGLVKQMVRTGEGLGNLAAGLLHGYAMASHVAHADLLGVGMVMEREYRSAERRDAANRAHGARLISDQLWYCALRLLTGYRFIGAPIDLIQNLMNDESEVWQALAAAQEHWYSVEYRVAPDRSVGG